MSSSPSPSSPKPNALLSKERAVWLFENFFSLGLAILAVLVVRSSILEPYKIPSGSMIPTLLVGDHIFVKKFEYGWKLPFGEFFTGDPVYVTDAETPKRGDIIVFKFPKNPDIFYIKRVVAVAGDTIEMRDKRLFVNDQPIPTEGAADDQASAIMENVDPQKYNVQAIKPYFENHENARATVLHDNTIPFRRDYGPALVPSGHVFAMGDNRDHSSDGREWGFVPMNYIKGKAIMIWLSSWIDFDSSSFTFRPSRIGTYLY